MRPVIEEQGEDAHVDTTLVQEIHVADYSRPQRDGGADGKPVERPRDHDAGPGRAVARNYVGDGGEQRARHDDRPAPGCARERHDEQRPDAGEDEVHDQLVRRLDGSDTERAPERHERRVRCSRCHGTEKGQDRNLEADCQLEGRVPVLTEVRILEVPENENIYSPGDRLCVDSAEETAEVHVCPTEGQTRSRQSWCQHLPLSRRDGPLP